MFEWFKRKAAKRVEVPAPTPVIRHEHHATFSDEPKVTRQVGYIIVKDNISLTIDGKPYSIGRSHVNFDKIVAALKAEQFSKIEGLVNIAAKLSGKTKGRVTVNEFGEVLHDGKPVHNVVATRISEFMKKGLPFEPLVRFLENLMTNPSQHSIEQLYAFLEHGGFPITPDGCFLAYKGVTNDFKDIHTRQFDNSVGAKQNMDRALVDPNPHAACSRGFHVGTHEYAEQFARDGGGKLVMVKVNPRDAVSVPADHDFAKLRVCDYEVVAMCPGKVVEPLSTIGYEGQTDLAEDEWDGNFAHPYDMGEEAFESNKPKSSNPFPPESAERDDWDNGWNDAADDYAEGEADDDEWTQDAHETVRQQTVTKAPKRAACTYCGAKGGKKHAANCRRPQK